MDVGFVRPSPVQIGDGFDRRGLQGSGLARCGQVGLQVGHPAGRTARGPDRRETGRKAQTKIGPVVDPGPLEDRRHLDRSFLKVILPGKSGNIPHLVHRPARHRPHGHDGELCFQQEIPERIGSEPLQRIEIEDDPVDHSLQMASPKPSQGCGRGPRKDLQHKAADQTFSLELAKAFPTGTSLSQVLGQGAPDAELSEIDMINADRSHLMSHGFPDLADRAAMKFEDQLRHRRSVLIECGSQHGECIPILMAAMEPDPGIHRLPRHGDALVEGQFVVTDSGRPVDIRGKVVQKGFHQDTGYCRMPAGESTNLPARQVPITCQPDGILTDHSQVPCRNPIFDLPSSISSGPRPPLPMTDDLRDQFRRPLHDLRISLIDQCNFRCPYCMPAEIFGPDYAFLPRKEMLSGEEILRLARLFVRAGVRKIRLTGGEPLLRDDLIVLVAALSELPGIDDLALTTNGWLLEKLSTRLVGAGLRRINVSLDSLDPAIFGRMNGRGHGPDQVLAGIDAAVAAGLTVKVNMVVQKGVNDGEILPMARAFRKRGLTLRFIEFMDVGNCNHWSLTQVLPALEIVERISADHPLEPLDPNYRGEVASRYRYQGLDTEIGLIASVTEPFCRDCHRARLSADGRLFTCLFATRGTDLKTPLRDGATDDDLWRILTATWQGRHDRYSEERFEAGAKLRTKVEMSYIGG